MSVDGITSTIKSDHILNLFQEVEGTLPDDRKLMTSPIRKFLDMEPEEQMLYMFGRRTGIFSRLDDMNDLALLKHVENSCQTHRISLANVDNFTAEMMKRFI